MPVYKIDARERRAERIISEPLTPSSFNNLPPVPATSPAPPAGKMVRPKWAQIGVGPSKDAMSWSTATMAAYAVSLIWLTACFAYGLRHNALDSLYKGNVFESSSLLTALFAPLALLWGIMAFLQRSRDIRSALAPFIRQLEQLVYPAANAEARVQKISESLRAQAADLMNATLSAEKTMERVRRQLRQDMQQMAELQEQNKTGLEQTSAIVSLRAGQLVELSRDVKKNLKQVEADMVGSGDRFAEAVITSVKKANDASLRFQTQLEGPIERFEKTNLAIQANADKMDQRINSMIAATEKTFSRYDHMVDAIQQRHDALNSSADRIEGQMTRLNDVFAYQLRDMGQAIEKFGAVGTVITRSSKDFREDAERVVEEAALQMGRLSEALDKKLEETGGLLDRMVKTVQADIGAADQRLAQGLQDLQAALQQTAGTTPQLLEAILEQVTGRLQEFESRFSHSTLTTGKVFDRLQEKLEQRVIQLGTLANEVGHDITHHVTGAMNHMTYKMRAVRDQFSGALSDSNRELSQFHEELAYTIEGLATVARHATDRTVQRIAQMNGMITDNLLRLRDASDRAVGQTAIAQDRLQQQADVLHATADDFLARAEMLEYGANAYALRIEDSTRAAAGLMDDVSTRVAREAEALQGVSRKAAEWVDEAARGLQAQQTELYTSVARSAHEIKQLAHNVEQRRQAIDNTNAVIEQLGDRTERHVSLYLNQASRLEQFGQNLEQSLNDRSQTLETRIEQVAEKAKHLQAVLRLGAGELMAADTRISERTQDMREALRSRAQEMAVFVGEIVAGAEQLMEKMDGQRGALRGAAMDIQVSSDMAQQAITRDLALLSVASQSAIRDVQVFAAELQAEKGEFANAADDAARQLMIAAEQYRYQIGQVTDHAGRAEQAVLDASQNLMTRQHLMNDLGRQVGHTYQHAGEVMAGLNEEIRQNLHGLRVNAEDATSQLRNMNYAASGALNGVVNAAQGANRELQDLQRNLARGQDDVSLTVQHSTQRMEQFRDAFSTHTQEMAGLVTNANERLNNVSQSIIDQTRALAVAQSEGQEQLMATSLQTQQRARDVAASLADNTAQIQARVQALQEQVNALGSVARQAGQSLNTETENLTERQDALRRGAALTQTQITTLRDQLREELQAIETIGNQSAQQLRHAIENLDRQAQYLNGTALETIQAVNTAGQQLTEKAESLQDAARTAQDKGQAILHQFADYIRQFNQTTDNAAKQVEQFRNAEIRARRDAFLNSAKFVIETLHSLSVDMTRVLDIGGADRLWKDFHKGDSGAFTRRLTGLRDEVSMDKIQNLFETNGEFRAYVQRYSRQFEELFDQAKHVDHGDLLTSTLMSSDIGKVYSFLSAALGEDRLRLRNAA